MGRFDILKQDDSQNREIEIYRSGFNFSEHEIEDSDVVNKVTETEEEIIRTAKQIAKKNLEMGKLLYETQQLMANYKNGTFVAWFNSMGLDKNMVYREINRWEQFQKYRNPAIAEASIRTLEFIKKNTDKLEEAEIVEILENPAESAKKIKEIEKKGKEEIKVNFDEKIQKLSEKIEKAYKNIEKWESEINKIKSKSDDFDKENEK